MRDFFVSYTAEDRKWAEWIAWQLEEAGFSVVVQPWEFSGNWLFRMDEAMRETSHTIAVLSPNYVRGVYTHPEWADSLRKDPAAAKELLIPVRVHPTDVLGILAQIPLVDLVDLSESDAVERLLMRIHDECGNPELSATTFPDVSANASPWRSVANKPPYPAEEETATRLAQAQGILVDWRGVYQNRVAELRAAAKKARAWMLNAPATADDEVSAVLSLAASVSQDFRTIELSHLKFATAYGLAIHPTVFWGQALSTVESANDSFGDGRSHARKRFDEARKALGHSVEEMPDKYAFEMVARVLESGLALTQFPSTALPRSFIKRAGDAPRIEDIRSYRTLVVARTDDDAALQLLALDDKEPMRLGSFAARTVALNALCARRDSAGWIDLVATDDEYLYRWSGTSHSPSAQYEGKTTLAGSFVTLGGAPAVVTVDMDGSVRRLNPDGGTTTVARTPDGVNLREATFWTDPFQPRRWRVIGSTERHDLVSVSPMEPLTMRSAASLWDDNSAGGQRRWNDAVTVGVHQLGGFPCILVTRQASHGELIHFLDPVLLNPLRGPMFVPGLVSRMIIVSGRWLVGFFMQSGSEVLPRVAVWDLRSDSNRPVGRMFERNGDVCHPFVTNESPSAFDALFVLRPFVDDRRHRLCRLKWP
ncbi:MAG TPA: toll/interleukin-1 receptor domain-containing protein, partial [Gemmatimonadaceae bacterium]